MDEMIRTMIAKWNARVKKVDVVYHLGDFAFGNPKRWMPIAEKLQGNITLIRGNHDVQNGATLKRLVVDGRPIFNDVGDIEQLTLGGTPLTLCHYPYETELDDGRFMSMRPKDNGRWLLHGHTHRGPVVRGRMVNVGCMLSNFAPISWNEIQAMIKKAVDTPTQTL
jgi:calcineurin-like phosphoesterase family protein